MIRDIILCALLAGVANAARQIVVNPSPPPPGPTTGNVPGALVSIVAPDFSSATWTSTQSAALCAGLVANYTSLYDKKYIKCSVNSVVDTSAYGACAVQTQLYWADFAGSTAADATARTESRDLFINTLYSSPNNINVLGKVVNVNDTCSSAWVPDTGKETSGVFKNINGMPLVQCRQAILGTAQESYNSPTCTTANAPTGTIDTVASLCFTANTDSSVGAYGIDNGKVCPQGDGYVQAVAPPSAVAFVTSQTAGAGASVAYVMSAVSGQPSTVKAINIAAISSGAGVISSNFIAGQSMVVIGGISTSDFTIATTAGCSQADIVNYFTNTPVLMTGASFPTADAANGVASSFTVQVDFARAGCSAAPVFNGGASAINSVTIQNAWSPFCDTSIAFYQQFQKGGSGIGAAKNVCPLCGTAANNVMFRYNGPNAGKACRSGAYASSNGVVGSPAKVQTAGFEGTSCIAVGVANYGPTEPDNGKPMLRSDSPVPFPYDANQYAFPGTKVSCPAATTSPTGSCASSGSFPLGSIVAYDKLSTTVGGVSNPRYQAIAVDSEFNMMCSTPAVRSPIGANLVSTGITGGYFLGSSDGITVKKGAGTCNTYSKWWNGGTGTGGNNINSYGSVMADLPTLFSAPIIGPTPAPTPTPPPASPPSPKPTPPVPPPSPPTLICTYKGSYEITPLYGPCNKYYLASGTTSDCSNNYVNLRTKYQLGNKMARIRWAVATVAEKGLSTPTNVVAEARLSAKGSCTNRNLAAPSDPSKGLKVGGSSWKWQIVPYPGSDKCDQVNLISQNRLTTTAFLEVPRSCNTFRYNATDGGRQRFKMIKV